MRGYCEFYETKPATRRCSSCRGGCSTTPRTGQVLARDDDGAAIGFATVYWTWRTMHAARVAVLEDVFVAPEARGSGAAEALIGDALARAREHGARDLTWQTAKTNARAQAVYARVGSEPDDRWLDYSLPASGT